MVTLIHTFFIMLFCLQGFIYHNGWYKFWNILNSALLSFIDLHYNGCKLTSLFYTKSSNAEIYCYNITAADKSNQSSIISINFIISSDLIYPALKRNGGLKKNQTRYRLIFQEGRNKNEASRRKKKELINYFN